MQGFLLCRDYYKTYYFKHIDPKQTYKLIVQTPTLTEIKLRSVTLQAKALPIIHCGRI